MELTVVELVLTIFFGCISLICLIVFIGIYGVLITDKIKNKGGKNNGNYIL